MTLRLGLLALLFAGVAAPLNAADDVKIEPDVVYGHKDGMALTFDVVRPPKPNGAAVLWIQSGGWYSNWAEPRSLLPNCLPLLGKGFTVFIVRHGSAPKYAIPEVVEDVRRSVRFIRMRAKDLGVDPDRLGVMGGSAGGHLALVLATTADDGDPGAKDEVLKQSSRVAAAVALFPPTDISDWVSNPPEAIKRIPALKPPLTFDEKKAPDYSPLLHVSDKTAPVLLIHGDKDELVPVEHSRKMRAALEKAKVANKLVVVEGAGHGFSPTQNQDVVRPALLEWFETHLVGKKGGGAPPPR
jgi:acetyl esterase/lipase